MKQAYLSSPFLVLFFLFSSVVYGRETVVDLRVGGGLDFFQWSIANDITGLSTPNILSELTWENLNSIQTYAGIEQYFGSDNRFAIIGNIAYAYIYSGDNQDSDYLGNNRSSEFSRSNNSSDDSATSSYSLAIGYNFIGNTRVIFMPMLGYAEHEINLKMIDGFQTIPATGAFSGLDSSYDATWSGPWTGLRIGMRGEFSFYLDYRIHFVKYVGLANWNLRSDFQHPISFRHDADGLGQTLQLGLTYNITELISLGFNYTYQDWETDAGLDTVYFSNNTVSTTRLNEVVWVSDVFSLNFVITL